MPEPPSVPENVTVTALTYQPLLPAVPFGKAVIVGAVLSILMGLNVDVAGLAGLPALSTHVPLLAAEPVDVSVLTDPPVSTLLVPDSVSEQAKLTVTV